MKNHLVLLLLGTLFACQPSGKVFEDAICIENITTIDAENGLQEAQTVIIQQGKIIKVVSTPALLLSRENQIIDGTGKFLIPGLWDAHVHFAYIEELGPYMSDLFLVNGVTSLRDTGGKIGLVRSYKEQAEAHPTEVPRLMIAGPLLDGLPNVYDGSDPGRPPLSVGLADETAVKNQMEFLDSVGVDLFKAYEMLTPEQFKTIIAIAQEKGMKVTGHVPLSMDVISASNAGLNSMEHMRNLELSCAANYKELLKDRQNLLVAGKKDAGGILRSRIHDAQRATAIAQYDQAQADKVLQALADNETWQIPTLTLSTGFVEQPFAKPSWQKNFDYLPDSIAQQWKAGVHAFAQREITPFWQDYTAWLSNMVGQIHQKGIDIMAGTDCPIFFLTPGFSLHEELAVLVKAGLSPLEALKTATYNPARYFQMEQELGLIQEGMWADLVILNDNPLEDINHTLSIQAVFKQGKLFDRKALDEKLAVLRGL